MAVDSMRCRFIQVPSRGLESRMVDGKSRSGERRMEDRQLPPSLSPLRPDTSEFTLHCQGPSLYTQTMAKRQQPTGLNRTAESIGTGLGQLQAKYDAWMKQRTVLASELSHYMTVAQKMLGTLGQTAEAALKETKVAFGQADLARKRVISEEHKRRISVAAKARWAAKKSGGPAMAAPAVTPTRNVSPEVRAKLARLAKARWAKARKAGKTTLKG